MAQDVWETRTAVHDLCDGGYHKWLTPICGAERALDPDSKAFWGLCELVRKDIEGAFGILKTRFRIWGDSQLDHNPENIDRLV